jgi:hypothetical protein
MEKLLNRLFFLILPVLLGLSLTFSYYSAQKSSENSKRAAEISERLQQQNERLLGINDAQKASLDTTKADIKDLKETLLCIGQYFSRDDRITLKITSYSPCKMENIKTGEVTVVPIFLAAPQTTAVTPQVSGQTQCDFRNSGSSSNNKPCDKKSQSNSSQNKSEVSPRH